MPILPSELTDLILDNLHNDKVALSVCSTISRSWLPTCQFHLFRQITFKACQAQGSFLPLISFLRDSDTQHLIEFINTLILDGTDPEVCHAPIDEQSQNFGISCAQIYNIIALSPSLKTLVLRNLSFIRMEDCAPTDRHQFEIRHPSGFVIQSLILDSVGYNQHGIILMTTDEIDSLFSIFTFIGNFCMYDMTFFPQEIAIRHTSSPPSLNHMDTGKGPQSVYIDGCSALYLPFRSLEKRAPPKSLTVRCRDVLSVGKFLQNVGCRLERLDLDLELGLNGQLSTAKLLALPCITHNLSMFQGAEWIKKSLGFSRCTSLTSLTLWVYMTTIPSTRDPSWTYLRAMIPFLPASLLEFTICVGSQNEEYPSSLASLLESTEWKEIHGTAFLGFRLLRFAVQMPLHRSRKCGQPISYHARHGEERCCRVVAQIGNLQVTKSENRS